MELLGFVDEHDRAQQGGVKVGEPSGTQRFEAHPAVVGFEVDGEEVAELSVEVSKVSRGVSQGGDGKVWKRFETGGEPA